MVSFEPDLTEAVEAAAKNHWDQIFASSQSSSWSDLDPMTKLALREMVLPAVAKAAPIIAAQALRWAANKVEENWKTYQEREAEDYQEYVDWYRNKFGTDPDAEVSTFSLNLWAEEIGEQAD